MISNFISKYFIIFCTFILNSLLINGVTSKYYDDYYSFDGCVPKKTCDGQNYPEIYKTYIRGFGPNCEEDKEIMKNYFKCVDKFFECGYLTTYDRNGTIILDSNEGVKILNGIDISKMSEKNLELLSVPESLVKKLSPFFGLKGMDASNRLDSEKLSLTSAEAELLFNIYFEQNLEKFEKNFLNMLNDTSFTAQAYQNLTLEAKVGLMSINNIFGEIPREFHSFILGNEWDELSHLLKAFDLPLNLQKANFYQQTLRKNVDAYLIDSIDEHIQVGKVLGVFVIDLSNEYKSDLIRYETYINTIKSILKTFYDKEKCYECKNRDIHQYSIVVYRNESLLLTNFTMDYNTTMNQLDKIIIPDSWSVDTRLRNTADAIQGAAAILNNQAESFDKMKTIFLFSNGDPDDTLDNLRPLLKKSQINLAVLDMSLKGGAIILPDLAEGPYNYLYYDVKKWQDSDINRKCLGKQVINIFASQNIYFEKNLAYKNTSILHNNTIFFQTTRSSGQNLRISLYLNSFPQENLLKLFVSYDYPYPDWSTNNLMHAGYNYLPLKTLVIGKDVNNPIAFKNDQTVYFTLQGANSNFGIKIEDCDPNECQVGTNIDENNFPFPQWALAILIILAIIVFLFVTWYLMRCFRKKDTIDDVEAGLTSKYQNIKG
jgi:hypothetical protein